MTRIILLRENCINILKIFLEKFIIETSKIRPSQINLWTWIHVYTQTTRSAESCSWIIPTNIPLEASVTLNITIEMIFLYRRSLVDI